LCNKNIVILAVPRGGIIIGDIVASELDSGNKDIVILAVPRGGIIIGDIVASELAARLDVVVSRKIGAPNNPELAIGAVMPEAIS
jgi:predicted phosphoribosyltransferase